MKVKNGILRGSLKVKGGKLIKCMIKLKEGKIKEIKISGDFFMHPEEKIEELEKALKGVEFEKESIEEKLNEILRDVELVGIDKEDFINAIFSASPVNSNFS